MFIIIREIEMQDMHSDTLGSLYQKTCEKMTIHSHHEVKCNANFEGYHIHDLCCK